MANNAHGRHNTEVRRPSCRDKNIKEEQTKERQRGTKHIVSDIRADAETPSAKVLDNSGNGENTEWKGWENTT